MHKRVLKELNGVFKLSFKDWLIRLCGGYTESEVQGLRDNVQWLKVRLKHTDEDRVRYMRLLQHGDGSEKPATEMPQAKWANK